MPEPTHYAAAAQTVASPFPESWGRPPAGAYERARWLTAHCVAADERRARTGRKIGETLTGHQARRYLEQTRRGPTAPVTPAAALAALEVRRLALLLDAKAAAW